MIFNYLGLKCGLNPGKKRSFLGKKLSEKTALLQGEIKNPWKKRKKKLKAFVEKNEKKTESCRFSIWVQKKWTVLPVSSYSNAKPTDSDCLNSGLNELYKNSIFEQFQSICKIILALIRSSHQKNIIMGIRKIERILFLRHHRIFN